MTTYRGLLKDSRWSRRRLEIMRRDNFRCRRCGAKRNLNVHHRWYIYGRNPWEYPDRCLVTLCEKCHRRTHLNRHLRYIGWIVFFILTGLLMRLFR